MRLGLWLDLWISECLSADFFLNCGSRVKSLKFWLETQIQSLYGTLSVLFVHEIWNENWNFSGKFFILGVGVWGPLFRKKHQKCVFFGYLPWYLVMDGRTNEESDSCSTIQFQFSEPFSNMFEINNHSTVQIVVNLIVYNTISIVMKLNKYKM